jgi:outer membrane receptor protein involved in Fe transport
MVTGSELASRRAPSLADALSERLGGVTLEGTTANLFQPTLRFRGFTASPVLGLPQGVAVYQSGVRINEPFGDTVQFDLIPQFAIDQVQLSAGAQPTYGLNALGGVLSLQLKDGFGNTGFRGEVSGGSFGRLTGTAEYGANRGPWAVYLGATRFDETGWREASPSGVTQMVADAAFRSGKLDAGVSFTYADTSLNGNSAAPVELLAVDRTAVFTFPDTTDNRLAFVQGRVNVVVSPTWTVQMNGYLRNLDRRTLNGDEAEFGVCDMDTLPPGAPGDTLCFGVGADDDGVVALPVEEETVGLEGATEVEEQPLVDVRSGHFITAEDAVGDAAFNRTTTGSTGYGATVQVTGVSGVGSRDNQLTLGLSADLAAVDFMSNSEVGTLTPERSVAGSGLLAGVFGEAPDDRFNTSLDTKNRSLGMYVTDMLSPTERVHLTASGRFNHTRVQIIDRLGTSLNGDHVFSRFNVGVGSVFDLSEWVSAFGRFAESNRAPTAAELSCADPDEPCRVPNAFVSDPPLEQAVARSVEGGLRGRAPGNARAGIEWSIVAFRTAIDDDIIFVASPELIGTGFFQNAGNTRRVGLDVELSGQVEHVGWFASYGLVEATFESALELPSNPAVNDAASAEGTLRVEPGDRLPGIPRHSFKAGIRYGLTEAWDLAFETIAASSRVLVGDEGNDQPELDGYGIANLRSVYRLSDGLEVFVRIDNLFDKEYGTFGALAELEIFLSEAPDAEVPRFVTPGAPRSGFAGIQIRF